MEGLSLLGAHGPARGYRRRRETSSPALWTSAPGAVHARHPLTRSMPGSALLACCRYIDPMLGINAAELAILLAVVVATPLYFIVRLAVRSSK